MEDGKHIFFICLQLHDENSKFLLQYLQIWGFVWNRNIKYIKIYIFEKHFEFVFKTTVCHHELHFNELPAS